jgi:acetyl-CoA C-acetyltransferase
MNEVFIVSAVRTPIGSFGGKLSSFSAIDLGTIAVKGALEKAAVKAEDIQEMYFGNVVAANLGQAPARQVALKAGLSIDVPCTTVNKVCSSGLKSVMIGAQSIMLGTNDLVMTGGMESMSNIPFYVPTGRWGNKFGNTTLVDGMVKDALQDVYGDKIMGLCGDQSAEKYNISRAEQDEFAITSYKRAADATSKGYFKNEIIPVSIPQRKADPIIMDEDEEFSKVDFDKIPTLRPVFSKEGTVTAANASTINDGASAVLLASAKAVSQMGLKPIARIVAFADAAQAPEWFTTSPAKAAVKALNNAGLTVDQIDYFEVNEAFAVVGLLFNQAMDVDASKVNVFGGAVSLGHPLGASGARILTTLQNVLTQHKAKYGLATICNGGGGASSIIIENLS